MLLTRILRHLFSSSRERARRVLPARTAPGANPPNFVSSLVWASAAPQETLRHAKALTDTVYPGHHIGDNMVIWGRNMSMLEDRAFVDAWRSNIESPDDEAIVWRRYVLACAAYHCVQLDGDFVECGAYAGVDMKTVMDYLGGPAFPKTFWGYDIFERDPGMLNHAMNRHREDLHSHVLQKFASYPQVRIVKGLIPRPSTSLARGASRCCTST